MFGNILKKFNKDTKNHNQSFIIVQCYELGREKKKEGPIEPKSKIIKKKKGGRGRWGGLRRSPTVM